MLARMKSGTAVFLGCAGAMAALLVVARVVSRDAQQAPPQAAQPSHAAAPGKTGTASIAGRVRYAGPPLAPERKPYLTPECAARAAPDGHGAAPIADGPVANAFVWIREGVPPGDYPLPSQPVELDQRGCEFSPRVFGIRAGQLLEVINDDPLLHNVHALGEGGGMLSRGQNAFNVAMPVQHGRAQRLFSAPQVMVTITCDVHPWMRAYAGVVAHPFFAVTGADGAFHLDALPAGKYVLEAWHERLGRTTREISLIDGARGALELEFGRKERSTSTGAR
jgi:hypothetical protein